MAFRFEGTRIIGPRGDSGSLIFTAEDAEEFTNRDYLVFFLSRRGNGGMVMTRAMEIDENGRAVLDLSPVETSSLLPGMYVWSARYVLDATIDGEGNVTGGSWVDTPWRNCEFEVLEVNGQV